jgi:hypothetical protein
MDGENKEQKERTHIQARKQKPSTRWQVKGVGKNHVPYPYQKKHVRKG